MDDDLRSFMETLPVGSGLPYNLSTPAASHRQVRPNPAKLAGWAVATSAARRMTSQGLVLLFEVGTWPPHDGFRRIGRFNLWSVLADDGRQGLRPLRTHPTRRPREDTFLPEQNSLNFLSALPTVHAA